MTVTSACADFTIGLKLADIPAEAVKWVKWGILDTTGVTLAGSTTETSSVISKYLDFVGGNPQARVVGLGTVTSAPEAAMAGGTLAHALDYDDVGGFGHPTAVLAPAIFALADLTKPSGKEVIEAYVAGYEVGNAMADRNTFGKIDTKSWHLGWHPTGPYGTIGATATAARLLKLTREQTMHAFGIAASEADRLAPVVESLSQRYLGLDWNASETKNAGDGIATAADVRKMDAARSLPLCMSSMLAGLDRDKHLKHKGRLQLGLFLKGAGLPLEEAMRFWRDGFGNLAGDDFDKRYAYGIRFNYGKEGKRADYTPYSCVKIVTTPVDAGDCAGCPYKTQSPEVLANLLSSRLKLSAGDVSAVVARARQGHYQLACASAWEAVHEGKELDSGVNHPNQYFDASRRAAREEREKKAEEGGGGGVKKEGGGEEAVQAKEAAAKEAEAAGGAAIAVKKEPAAATPAAAP